MCLFPFAKFAQTDHLLKNRFNSTERREGMRLKEGGMEGGREGGRGGGREGWRKTKRQRDREMSVFL